MTVMYRPNDITLMNSLYPLVVSAHSRMFDFKPGLSSLEGDRNDTLIIFRFFGMVTAEEGPGVLRRLRDRYRTIAYFDDTADPREVRKELMPYVDFYYKKQLLKDRSLYGREMYGKRVFTDWIYKTRGVVDDRPAVETPLSEAETRRLRLSWNLGMGSFPKTRYRRALCIRLGGTGSVRVLKYLYARPVSYRWNKRKKTIASGRVGTKYDRNTVHFHRAAFLGVMKDRPDLFLTGKVPLEKYNREMRQVAATVSPFGWGEICFRDFEAIVNRSVLLKPDMSHIETWPDVYRAAESYIPVSWDASDLVAKTEQVLADERARNEISQRAAEIYLSSFDDLDAVVSGFVETIASG